jgi:16S rRNA A1518/A1519 N6-dimethyltransferase RsmA/KsgA/DIM1 with predicted DNA glycosylase/AP lyase activity
LFVVIVLFSFPRFSPIPYFPSNGKDIPLIIKALQIQNNQTIIDLGAGDGIVILKSATEAFQNKLNTQFIAVEINPILLLILYIRRLFHPNRKNIKIMRADMFTMHYSLLITNHYPLTTFYIYISPWFIEKTVSNITRQIKKFDLISYFYQVKCLPKHKEEMQEGVHNIYSYKLVTNR